MNSFTNFPTKLGSQMKGLCLRGVLSSTSPAHVKCCNLRGGEELVALQRWELNLLHMQFRTSGEKQREGQEGGRERWRDLRTLHYRKVSREIGKPINSLGSSKTAKLLYCFYPTVTNSKNTRFFVTKFCKLLITNDYFRLRVRVKYTLRLHTSLFRPVARGEVNVFVHKLAEKTRNF